MDATGVVIICIRLVDQVTGSEDQISIRMQLELTVSVSVKLVFDRPELSPPSYLHCLGRP